MRDNEFTRILDWPGYRVFRHEIDETAKTLRLWVRRRRGNRKLTCSGCGRKFSDAHDGNEREVRDLTWGGRAKARRYDKSPGSSEWQPAPCERSTCGICSAGVQRVAKSRYYKWV